MVFKKKKAILVDFRTAVNGLYPRCQGEVKVALNCAESKHEARNPKQIQNSNVQNPKQKQHGTILSAFFSFWSFEFRSFEFVSNFDIRISDLSTFTRPCLRCLARPPPVMKTLLKNGCVGVCLGQGIKKFKKIK
jgi:hypothetical protein